MSNRYKESKECGFTLITVLMVLVVLSILGLSIIAITSNSIKTTTGERGDQSVYYIAEAGLNERRAYLHNQVSTAIPVYLAELAANEEEDPEDRIKPEVLFYNVIKNSVSTGDFSLVDFEPHFNESNISATVKVTGDGKNYKIRSIGNIGGKQRTVSQNIQIIFDTNSIPKQSTGNNKPLNSCFALYTSGSINRANGTINGDIYSTEKLVISNSGSAINGSVYSTEDIEINGSTGIKDVSTPKNVKIGGGTISGSVYAGESFTINNGNISGDVAANGKVTMTGGSISGSLKTNNTFSISNGTVQGDVKSVDTITASGGTIKGNAISKNNVSIINYPSIGNDIIAIKDIYVKEWFSSIGGNYRYGSSIKFDKNVNAGAKLKPLTSEERANILDEKFVTESVVNVSNGRILNDCTTQIPTLANVNDVFLTPSSLSYPDDKTEAITKNGDTKNYKIIQNGSLKMNDYLSDEYELVLNNDMYFKSIDFSSSNTLYIDLKNGKRSIYVDSLNMPNGHIKLINPGILNIHVLDNMTFGAGSSITNGDNKEKIHTNIYYSGNKSFMIDGGVNMFSTLHVKDADFTITAGGGVHGDVFVYGNNDITVSGGSSVAEQLFLAPNSEFNHNNGTINGNVVAKYYHISGGATISPPKGNNDSTKPEESEVEYEGNYYLLDSDPQIEE